MVLGGVARGKEAANVVGEIEAMAFPS